MSATEHEITDVEFWDQHRGHELEVKDGFNETPSISSMGTGLPRDGTGKCPACDIEVSVLVTGKICHHHDYGEHIDIKCTECGAEGHTKNIDQIGARRVYQNCSCEEGWFVHECPVDEVKRE